LAVDLEDSFDSNTCRSVNGIAVWN